MAGLQPQGTLIAGLGGGATHVWESAVPMIAPPLRDGLTFRVTIYGYEDLSNLVGPNLRLGTLEFFESNAATGPYAAIADGSGIYNFDGILPVPPGTKTQALSPSFTKPYIKWQMTMKNNGAVWAAFALLWGLELQD